jgi:hypothetical protein
MEPLKCDKDQLKDWIQGQKSKWMEVNPPPVAKAKIWSQLGLESIDPTIETPIIELPMEAKAKKSVNLYWFFAVGTAAVLLIIWAISAKLAITDLEQYPQLVGVEDSPSQSENSAVITDQMLTESVSTELEWVVKKSPMHKTKVGQIASNNDEIHLLPNQAEHKLLEQIASASLASNRIEGIIALASLESWSEQAVVQLLNTAKQDDNSNVRAAAIEVLMGRAEPQYHQALIEEVLAYQHDPMIQFELILRLNAADEINLNAKTAEYLYAVAEDPLAFDFVREQAYTVLLKSL